MIIKKLAPVAILFAGILLLSGCGNRGESPYDTVAFGQCLTDNEIVMYGAFWCPHCADQKEILGDGVDYITYVECDPNDEAGDPELCLKKEILSYPTWIHPDGRRWSDVLTLEELSDISACELELKEGEEIPEESIE